MPLKSTANIDVPAGKTIAVVNAPAWSKINWTQIIGAGAILGSFFGLHVDAPTQAAIITVIGLATQGVTFLLRTFGHGNPPTSSL